MLGFLGIHQELIDAPYWKHRAKIAENRLPSRGNLSMLKSSIQGSVVRGQSFYPLLRGEVLLGGRLRLRRTALSAVVSPEARAAATIANAAAY